MKLNFLHLHASDLRFPFQNVHCKLDHYYIITTAVQPVATCPQSPYLHKPATVIVTSFSLWHLARGARSPHSHYDVILIVTSFTTELVTPTVADVRTPYRV